MNDLARTEQNKAGTSSSPLELDDDKNGNIDSTSIDTERPIQRISNPPEEVMQFVNLVCFIIVLEFGRIDEFGVDGWDWFVFE